MEVELEGVNIPKRIIDDMPKDLKKKATPEVISAASARISRSKKSIDELFKEAIEDVPTARESNQAIIYGMGHHSIADHVLFNFAIKDVSRLVVESIEKRRLAGYTERSQRYVTFKDDFVIPEEFKGTDIDEFIKVVKLGNDFYKKANNLIFDNLKKKNSEKIDKMNEEERKVFFKKLEGITKEDARYALSLATKTQLVCSYSGQTAELAIRELKYSPIAEEREFANKIYKIIYDNAPSLIQLTDHKLFKRYNKGEELKDEHFKYTRENLENVCIQHISIVTPEQLSLFELERKKVKHYQVIDKEERIIAALLFSYTKLPFECCLENSRKIVSERKVKKFVIEGLKYISEYDKLPREFESSIDMYEIEISASGFAQLKRHRMNTILPQTYNINLPYEIPDTIREVKLENELKEVCYRCSELYSKFIPKYGRAAEYCLTNAHKRRVLFMPNFRQICHVSRIREEEDAQWEIRGIVKEITDIEKRLAPSFSSLLGSKSKFRELRKEIYREKNE